MVTTLDDTKRMAIGEKLASMKVVQDLLIGNEQKLASACDDPEITKRLNEMLESDRKNMGIIDTVIVQYGVQGEPKETVKKLAQAVDQLMEGSELSLYEKVAQHELLKHQQVMSGLLVHKAAQVVGADVEAAITPLNTVNFENRAHQEQLKGVMEVLGVREMTGQEAKQGIWSRVQDAMAAMSGVAGSVISNTDDEMNIQDVIRMDHAKVNTLFMQINNTDDPQKIQEYFGQIYKDLTVHAEAEEQAVYPAVRSFYGENDTQELYDEQASMKVMLDALLEMNPSAPEFKTHLNQLKDVVMDHVRQEESTMFAAIRNNCTSEQQEQLATQFKAVKSDLQKEMASSMK
jgi:hemerythrin superfamily protein